MSDINQISEFAAAERISGQDGSAKTVSVSIHDEGRKQYSSHEVISTEVSDAEMKQLAEALNKAADAGNQQLRFEVDEETRHHVIKVVDKETLEVIRQFPGEELLNIRRALKESVEKDQPPMGILLDTRV